MHILTTIMSLDPVGGGGTAERTFQLSRHLAAAGERCTLLTLDIDMGLERKRALSGVTVFQLPCINRRFYVPLPHFNHIARFVAAADVVHLMNHWTLLNAMVYRETLRQRKPYAVCPAGALQLFGRSGVLKRFYNRLAGRNLIVRADRFIAITDSEIQQYIAYGGRSGNVTVIPNGIDPMEFDDNHTDAFRRQFSLPPNAPLILFLGRLDPIKGPDILLEAFARVSKDLKGYHLVFAGPDGGMQSDLEAICRGAGLDDRVHFIGYIGGALKSQAYHAARFLVIPSRQEAMSIVALEAGVSGTPVLLTDACGFEAIEQVGGGMVVSATVTSIAHGLTCMAAQDVALDDMGTALRRYVLAHYTWESIADQHLRCFQKLVG